MRERIQNLLREMNHGIYEKESEIGLALLAAIAGESVILLGPPGVAKSMIARRLKSAFKGAASFEYLMSRFSTPDEIFGPVSISRLKKDDVYQRATSGYLPTADVVFLDEIWKAGPAIQNTLLTVINEKLFRNGNTETHLPLKLLVAASNELPAKGEGLEALWDRFIIRIESQAIRREDNFNAMLLGKSSDFEKIPDNNWQINNEEYAKWQKEISNIGISNDSLSCINVIRHAIKNVDVDNADERRDIYVSDRRWKKIAQLLRTSAFIHDHNNVEVSDIMPVYHCLWQEPDESDAVRRIVIHAIFTPLAVNLAQIKQNINNDISHNNMRIKAHGVTAIQKKRDADKKCYSDYYYRLPQHETGHTFVIAADYQQLPEIGTEGAEGLLYSDPRNPKITVIKTNDGGHAPLGCRPVSLMRDNNNLYIDGIRYALELMPEDDMPVLDLNEDSLSSEYSSQIEVLADKLKDLQKNIESNLFVNDDDRKEIKTYLSDFYKEIAFTRQDLEKLL